MTGIFLDKEDMAILTGWKIKSKQIDALRKMGLPFWLNAAGYPIVTVAAVEGRKETRCRSRSPPKQSVAPPRMGA